MHIRHLLIAALFVAAGAAQARAIGPNDTVQLPAPAPLELHPAPAELTPVVPEAADVPEPSSIALLLAGAIGVGALRRRRSR